MTTCPFCKLGMGEDAFTLANGLTVHRVCSNLANAYGVPMGTRVEVETDHLPEGIVWMPGTIDGSGTFIHADGRRDHEYEVALDNGGRFITVTAGMRVIA